ncbi:hypothetical protein SAMN05421493_103151 [Pseudobutyrivibrio sp. 49]|nr:hypothetical protein SAMN05421493_103151 [Pseudobutyrivibrio sp. 49]
MAKGSVSVFFTFILVSVMCLIFTMSECIRFYEMQSFAQEYTDIAVESTFSEYNAYLWTNYKILAVDLGYGSSLKGPENMEEKTLDYCKYNADVSDGFNYARLFAESCTVNKYAFLTDKNGEGVIGLGVQAAKDGMAGQVVDGIQNHIDTVNGIEKIPVEEKVKSGKSSLDNAKAELAEKRRAAAEDDNPDTNPDDYPEPEEVEDNPLEAFDILKESFSKGVLATVTNAEKLSDVSVSLEKMPSHRQLSKGNLDFEEGVSLVDKALFLDYLITNYSYFGHDLEHDGLNYEVEYLLSGKETDPQCLASVVEQLLLVREGANFITIQTTRELNTQALSMAEALAGFTGNPVIIEAVYNAVIGAWAYAEATLDVRLLLNGGKIAPIKNLTQWTTDLWHLSNVCNINFKARDCGEGTGYKEYLIGFLALRTNEKLATRALDIMENALNSTDDYKDVKVDNMVWAADIEMTYSAKEMFLSLFERESESKGEIGQYYFARNKFISY